jgi:hypothetical protein
MLCKSLSVSCPGELCQIIVPTSFDIIALAYGLDDQGSRVPFPSGAGNFSLHHRVQNGSGTHPASYSMGTRGSSPGVKQPRCEVAHSLVPR